MTKPEGRDTDMAQAYLAGYVTALQRERPNAVIAVDLGDIADDFDDWVTDYELNAQGSSRPMTEEPQADNFLDAADRLDTWANHVDNAYADGGYAAGDGPTPPDLDDIRLAVTALRRQGARP
jgi:hypothetical protein